MEIIAIDKEVVTTSKRLQYRLVYETRRLKNKLN